MIPRTLFTPEHETFRDSVRRFMEEEVKPHDERWQEQGHVDREVWRKAGQNGFLCCSMPEEYGGPGADKLYSMVLIEEQARANNSSLGWGLHSEIVAPYLLHYGSEALKQKYLPKMASGEMIGAIAMSEPAAGSDLQGVKTTAQKKGDRYVVNGSKTFITNGWLSDLVIVVAKTDPTKGAKGTSLIIVDTSMKGFTKGKRLKKLGLKASGIALDVTKSKQVDKAAAAILADHGRRMDAETTLVGVRRMKNGNDFRERLRGVVGAKQRLAIGLDVARRDDRRGSPRSSSA